MRRVPSPAKGSPAVCLACCEFIDLEALHVARARGERYVHDCGRVLIP
jgi:hypothetical protein